MPHVESIIRKAWVVCSDPAYSSCIVNSAFTSKESAENYLKAIQPDDHEVFWIEQTVLYDNGEKLPMEEKEENL